MQSQQELDQKAPAKIDVQTLVVGLSFSIDGVGPYVGNPFNKDEPDLLIWAGQKFVFWVEKYGTIQFAAYPEPDYYDGTEEFDLW